MEILELLKDKNIHDAFYSAVSNLLENKKSEDPNLAKLRDDGLAMLD
jgi:hypothetical protein